MQNRYTYWQYGLMALLLVCALLYAAPNLYGEDPAIQISRKDHQMVPVAVMGRLKQALADKKIAYLSVQPSKSNDILVRFPNTDVQLSAQERFRKQLGKDYLVVLNLAERTPGWLRALGARPMRLGLDLRGGVHFLLDVDVNALVKSRVQGDARAFGRALRKAQVRYSSIELEETGVNVKLRDAAQMKPAMATLSARFPDYRFEYKTTEKVHQLRAALLQEARQKIEQYAIDQNMTILRNRVNELGVSEAIVQQQGVHQISVDLPGIQDTARAKSLLGKAATLKFQLVDTEHDVASALSGQVPLGSKLYRYEGRPILLKSQVILRGSSITYANSGFDENGQPNVSIRLGGGGERLFHRITSENVGKPLAVVYVESHVEKQWVKGKRVKVRRQHERVINVATIQSALGSPFQIMGLSSPRYAKDLALLLRSGALAAPMEYVQERIVGPSMGRANIHKGILSIEIGSLLVFVFMLLYYRVFGIIADIALLLNIVFIVAILSVVGATLTLPGIAGIVLTVGMAVDANVLINERIREELRQGMSPQAAIHAGYERAFTTIVDANVTTLIVALVLFALGSAAVKGFAVTVTIGLLTSMVTAVFFTRGLVNGLYGKARTAHALSIGTIKTGR